MCAPTTDYMYCSLSTKVIRSEFCVPCGRRTKFGKVYLRCQDCRLVTHPECRERSPMPCNPTAISTPINNAEVVTTAFSTRFIGTIFHSFMSYLIHCWLSLQATLADFAPVTSPKIPALVIYCIKEIERRGLHEVRKKKTKTCLLFHA